MWRKADRRKNKQELLIWRLKISDDLRKAEALSNQFFSVFTVEDKDQIPSLGDSDIPDINRLVVNKEGVLKQIMKLKPDKAPGPDGISPWMLRMCANEITPVLTDWQWREANICPIFKKGAKEDPANYMGVSLTSVVSKILQHIIHSHIMKHLGTYNILVDNQHGFRVKHSTVTQLVLTIRDLTSKKGKQLIWLFLTLPKHLTKSSMKECLGNLPTTESEDLYSSGWDTSSHQELRKWSVMERHLNQRKSYWVLLKAPY